MDSVISLGSIEKAFTQGGNRLCFFHPQDSRICIKITRPDRTPKIRRAQKRFPKNLRALSSFDENQLEAREMQWIHRAIGEQAYELIPRCYGMVDTDLGRGLSIEMIRDHDGRVSLSLKQYLWQTGLTETLQQALKHFGQQWSQLGMPSRDLLLHNIVVQQADKQTIKRLVVIDGLGWSGLSRLCYFLSPFARYRATQKIQRLHLAIKQLLVKQKQSGSWGYHGWLDESQRQYSHHD